MKIIKELPRLPKRPRNSHKGDYGRVLIIAGSRGMAGAARLAAEAALRSGSGLVTVATPKSQQPILAKKITCQMTYALPETKDGTIAFSARNPLLNLAKKQGVIAIGPGLSQNPQTIKLVLLLVPDLKVPTVIDADGLNALSKNVNTLKKAKAPLILTPHPGEMAKLIGSKVQWSKSSRDKIAVDFAKRYKVIVVLKGHQTVVTDGEKVYINKTGNPGMATAGSGDVLTGVIAGLLGQDLRPFEAAQLGVYIHGLAGDLAAKKIGELSLIATDILEFLPSAFRRIIK
ncbi:MAG: NAD(P)H-hydrate dehydratase [Planctomycetes bacterium]|nr:NAD(P)H-hydrate dehydratase [Planctomycetota bacterium]